MTPYIASQNLIWSSLFQVMACCLTAPSHYLDQCWLIVSGISWPQGPRNKLQFISKYEHFLSRKCSRKCLKMSTISLRSQCIRCHWSWVITLVFKELIHWNPSWCMLIVDWRLWVWTLVSFSVKWWSVYGFFFISWGCSVGWGWDQQDSHGTSMEAVAKYNIPFVSETHLNTILRYCKISFAHNSWVEVLNLWMEFSHSKSDFL